MTTATIRQRLKELTMGCWWPTKYSPKPQPDWDGILGELKIYRDYPNPPEDLEQLIIFVKEKLQ